MVNYQLFKNCNSSCGVQNTLFLLKGKIKTVSCSKFSHKLFITSLSSSLQLPQSLIKICYDCILTGTVPFHIIRNFSFSL